MGCFRPLFLLAPTFFCNRFAIVLGGLQAISFPRLRRVLAIVSALLIAYLVLWQVLSAVTLELIICFVIGAISVFAYSYLPSTRSQIVISTLLLVPILTLANLGGQSAYGPAMPDSRKFLRTAYYNLEVAIYRNDLLTPSIVDPAAPGGAIDRLGNGYLLALGDGRLRYFSFDNGLLKVRSSGDQIPINRKEFINDTLPHVRRSWFRVTDSLLRDESGVVTILAAYNYWHGDRQCHVARLARTTTTAEAFLSGEQPPEWEVVHETKPCLPLKRGEAYRKGSHPYGGLRSGGRLAWLSRDEVLLSVGDYTFGGWDTPERYPQDEGVSHGKVLVVDLNSGEERILSRGHRTRRVC